MPKDNEIRSILLIGSGPIIIGQACEPTCRRQVRSPFDHSPAHG